LALPMSAELAERGWWPGTRDRGSGTATCPAKCNGKCSKFPFSDAPSPPAIQISFI